MKSQRVAGQYRAIVTSPSKTAISQVGKRDGATTGADAGFGAELDCVFGLRMGLPHIISRAGILARPFYGWNLKMFLTLSPP